MGTKKLTTSEAAEWLGVSTARVRQLVLNGRLPAEKFGRDLSIDAADVEAFQRLKGGRPRKDETKDAKSKRGKGAPAMKGSSKR